MTVKIVYTDQGTILMSASDLLDVPAARSRTSVDWGDANRPPGMDPAPGAPAPLVPNPLNAPIGDPKPDSDRKVWPRPKSGPGVMIVGPHSDVHERMVGLFAPDNRDVYQLHLDLGASPSGNPWETLRKTVHSRVKGPGSPLAVLNVAVPAQAMQNGNTFDFERLLEQESPGLAGIRLFVKDWASKF